MSGNFLRVHVVLRFTTHIGRHMNDYKEDDWYNAIQDLTFRSVTALGRAVDRVRREALDEIRGGAAVEAQRGREPGDVLVDGGADAAGKARGKGGRLTNEQRAARANGAPLDAVQPSELSVRAQQVEAGSYRGES